MVNSSSVTDEFRGFNKARSIMWCHEIRARVIERLELTSFLADVFVAAVHVDNTSRADRVYLTGFDSAGRQLSGDTLYIDEPSQHLDIAPEFDHDFTNMAVTPGSELEAAINREYGWVINMRALRAYDLIADRRATQRAVLLAHLPDLMNRGEARGFLFGSSDSGNAGAA
ncbi:hypothetical protein [Arthrobacter bambusae]|uniref:Uncharacterized protein n=1 Tax=Arthrobacter bambusae TaxID=1338426 RepID=A0AAW8D758_9MICC|nr:hypothetical protein [Arthrobacter bambusae]MDP9904751.1 hypothetical protein [Arthrobacter bambusae]MDQ0129567.1 hypothetical protein [Arthrobacter bambusae]MDQ0180820.1 hypothetical protein [Arthrobacter bambusae]